MSSIPIWGSEIFQTKVIARRSFTYTLTSIFITKDFDENLIPIADRPVELICRKKDRSLASFRSYSRSYGYYNHFRSRRHIAMETLNIPKKCSSHD